MYTITKQFNLSAAHHLEDYVGKCATPHGHNYDIHVAVKTDTLQENGIGTDFGDIKKAYNELIHNVYDHQDLNTIPPFDLSSNPDHVQECNPTAENMCRVFYYILKDRLPDLFSIKIYETPTSYCEYVEDAGDARVQK